MRSLKIKGVEFAKSSRKSYSVVSRIRLNQEIDIDF